MTALTNDRGGALMIALALMAMLTVIAVMALNRSNTDVDLSFNQLHDEQAFYAAEAGVERALAKLNTNRSWDSGFVSQPLGDRAFYTVSVTDSTAMPVLFDTVIIKSSGRYDRAEAEVEAWVVPEKFHPFDFALFGDTTLEMTNSSCTDSYNSDSGSYGATLDHTDATIGSNGEVILGNIASVGGDAVSAIEGGISILNEALVRGDTITGVDSIPIDDIVPPEEYDWAQENSVAETGISGTYTYDPVTYSLNVGARETAVLSSGVYYFSDIEVEQNGTIVIEPGAEVIIYMTGDLTLRNFSNVNADGTPAQLIIYSSGDLLTLDNNTSLTAAFFGPDVTFELRNYTDFFGSVVADEIIFANNVCFHYDRYLSQIEKGETGRMIVVAWREM
ncbi:MAG: pilus assembly PilX N-terminal domain-containing protein [Candidatus Zixiibacteriota bacterium]|nr:MAG: pilus assembly PilX N-terminal domain-containing protein [candidate division Zixibacteria bacterium]